MTKKQLKEEYKNWRMHILKLGERKQEILNKLQIMCADKGNGKKLVCIEMMVEELAKKGYVYTAMNLVSEYYEISGQEAALRSLAMATNNLDI